MINSIENKKNLNISQKKILYNKKIKKLLNNQQDKQNTFLTKISNGRVNIMGTPLTNKLFPLFKETTTGNLIYNNEALKSIQNKSKLSDLYFSQLNIDSLQNILKYRVWLESNKKHKIANQSEHQLKIIMRSIFLQNGKFNNNNILDQVKELNEKVIKYCLPNILSNIEMYIAYKKTVSYLPIPIILPENVSIKGTTIIY